MELFEQITASVSSFLWGWPMIILLLGTHIFLTIRLKFPQRKIFTAIRLSFKKDPDSEGDVSQFGALATSLAAFIGKVKLFYFSENIKSNERNIS